MNRVLLLVGFTAVVLLAQAAPAQDKAKVEASKKGLQILNDFVGSWNGDGKTGPFIPKRVIWAETMEWGWKFKADDAWMVLKFKDSKSFKSGEIRYIAAKKGLEATLTDLKDQKLVFDAKMDKETLILERTDPKTKDSQRVRINVAGDGIFLNLALQKKASGKTIFLEEYKVAYKMEGASLGAREKKQECIVSGGLGTSAVTYKGQTYYICCSGCRDAFNENPEYYVKQWEAKKNKK